jgi:hypothetical protein
VTNLGFFLQEPVKETSNYTVDEIIVTPLADEVILFSNESFAVNNGSVGIKKRAEVNVANQELGLNNNTEYAFNRQINVSSAFEEQLQNVSLGCVKGAWGAYSTYLLVNGSYEKINSTESNSILFMHLPSLNESVIISYEPMPPAAPIIPGGGSQAQKKQEVPVENLSAPERDSEKNETEKTEQAQISVSVFSGGDSARVVASSLGCWSRLDGGSFEEMAQESNFSLITYAGVKAGAHIVFVKCPSGNASGSFEVVGDERATAITAMAVVGGDGWLGLAVFCVIACAVTVVFLRKEKTANILSR